jgi:plasmid stabilization system protein ParE
MRIAFSRPAGDDLRSIIAWYEEVAPASIGKVQADINRRLDLISKHPFAGMASPDGRFRHISTPKYRYKIVYRVEVDRMLIVGIFRHQNRTS